MMEDLEILGLELTREIRMRQEELQKKRDIVADLTKKQALQQNEIEESKEKLRRAQNEVQEVRAQLRVRSEATQRLEQDNVSLRDRLATLQVQVDTTTVERDRLLQKWQLAEGERIKWKEMSEKLKDENLEMAVFKEQCQLLQNQLRNSVSKINTQQELVKRDFAKLELIAAEAMNFSKTVAAHSKQQEAKTKDQTKALCEAEKKLIELSATLGEVQKERDRLAGLRDDQYMEKEGKYYIEWQKYQVEMKKRVEGLIGDNQRLAEELNLLRDKEATQLPENGESVQNA